MNRLNRERFDEAIVSDRKHGIRLMKEVSMDRCTAYSKAEFDALNRVMDKYEGGMVRVISVVIEQVLADFDRRIAVAWHAV